MRLEVRGGGLATAIRLWQGPERVDTSNLIERAKISRVERTWPSALIGERGPVGSRLGMGTHSLHRRFSASARRRLLDLAYDCGVRYFDTAPSYGAGLAERMIGRFAYGRRSKIVVATKFGIALGGVAMRLPAGAYLAAAAGAAVKALRGRTSERRQQPRDYSAARARESVEASLRRLRTDYVDILYLHEPTLDLLGEVDDLARTLEALRMEGKIRKAGLSGQAAPCGALARLHPALAEVLQVEVPADPDGLPCPVPLDAAAGIGFWEFPARRPAAEERRPEEVLDRLHRAVPAGMILLSTRDENMVRAAAGIVSRWDPVSGQSFAHGVASGA